jgi:hypothetical protein
VGSVISDHGQKTHWDVEMDNGSHRGEEHAGEGDANPDLCRMKEGIDKRNSGGNPRESNEEDKREIRMISMGLHLSLIFEQSKKG